MNILDMEDRLRDNNIHQPEPCKKIADNCHGATRQLVNPTKKSSKSDTRKREIH